jgi:hypothetical protein
MKATMSRTGNAENVAPVVMNAVDMRLRAAVQSWSLKRFCRWWRGRMVGWMVGVEESWHCVRGAVAGLFLAFWREGRSIKTVDGRSSLKMNLVEADVSEASDND